MNIIGGYKNHILVDCITGLPIFKMTTTANVSDNTVDLDILSQINQFISVEECTSLIDKGYDIKTIYRAVKKLYHGKCVISLNKRSTKSLKKLSERSSYLRSARMASFSIMAEHVRNIAIR